MMTFNEELYQALHGPADQAIMDYKGRIFTRGEIAGFGDRVVEILGAAGVPGDASVGMVLRNRPLQGAALVGLIAAARPLTTIYAFQAPSLLARDVLETRFAAVLADAQDWSPELFAAIEQTGAIGISVSHSADKGEEITRVSGPERYEGSDYHRIAGEPALEILSSGTTGKPKRIRFPYRMLIRTVDMVKVGQLDASLPPDICTWPFAGIGGMGNIVANMMIGRYMTVLDRFNVPEWVEAVKRHRPSFVSGPPAVAQMIVDADVPAEDLASIKYFYGGSAPITNELQDELLRRYGIVAIWAYGATEFCGTIISWSLKLHEEFGATKRGAMGRPVAGVEVRVVDPDSGEPLPCGAVGHLEAKVPAVGTHWIRTTDLAMIDGDGFIFHRGRGDGAILRGGFKVLPETIVEALMKHPAVFDASVVGLPDGRLGQVPVAAVQLRADAPHVGEAELLGHLRSELAATYIPRAIRIVDTLPRTPSLKIDQRAVAALFEVAA